MTQVVSAPEEATALSGNTFIGTPTMKNSRVLFEGTGNIFYCEDDVTLESCTIRFQGNNGLVILGNNKHAYRVSLTAYNDCSIVIGRNVYFNGCLNAIASEGCTIAIGDDCLLSFGIWIRTADPHLVYDIKSKRRLNYSRDVVIGDHVWIGQSAMILKGSLVGSGSIVGAMSVLAGKTVPSNCSFAGNPARLIRGDLFWDGASVHNWTTSNTKKHTQMSPGNRLFSEDSSTIIGSFVPERGTDAEQRLSHFLAIGYSNRKHNRLAISKPQPNKRSVAKRAQSLGNTVKRLASKLRTR